MSVYDKELIIDGKAVRSPEQQVYKNMKDIKDLQEVIKPEYTTDSELTSSSVSVAIADTNAPEGTTEGWLLTQDGLKFKITGGDETNLLLEFYADLKGPQGESGAELEIDDSGTSATKVWSSQKTNNEIINVNNPGAFTSYTVPTEDDGTYYLLRSNIYPVLRTLKTNDIIIIYDNTDLDNLTIKEIWEVGIINGTSVQVSKIGSVGGTQLHKHNITLKATRVQSGSYYYCYISFILELESNVAITTYDGLKNALLDKGYNSQNNALTNVTGIYYNGENTYSVLKLYSINGNIAVYGVYGSLNATSKEYRSNDTLEIDSDFVE